MRELFTDGWTFAKKILTEKENRELHSPQDFYNEGEIKKLDYEKVFLPHDWLIYDTKNLYQSSVGFYKKEFTLENEKSENSSLYFLRFEGIYQNWAAYINGKKACEWKYGYSTVEFCISQFLKKGKNTIEIIAVFQNPNSRWYSGAGIFRNVYLITKGKTRIAADGIYFHGEADRESLSEWKVTIETELFSLPDKKASDGFKIKHQLYDGDKIIEFTEIREEKGSKTEIYQTFTARLHNIIPWTLEEPHLYTLKTSLYDEKGTLIDEEEIKVGFRQIDFFPDRGFFLNGRHTVIHGVCEHHDFGLFGAEFNLECLKRKIKKLKKMGVNAVRCSHNPPPDAFLEVCDREGILVCDESFDMWEKVKTRFDYSNYFNQWWERDCRAWVKKDRNHPCVIMWSIGNEIFDTNFESGIRITKMLKDFVRSQDSLKNALITSASNHMGNELPQKCAQELELVGYNYAERLYEEHHKKNPDWCMYGSETGSHLQSRGIYHFPYRARPLTHPDNQCSSLGNTSVSWGARDALFTSAQDKEKPWTAGQFLWTGFDYIGEPTPYTTKNSYFGQLDTAGFEKDSFYVYKAAWTDVKKEPFIHIFPYWDWNEGQEIDAGISTNAFCAELFLNGVSLGKRKSSSKKPLVMELWQGIKFKKGKLTAVCYDEDGNEICREEKETFSDSCEIEAALEENYSSPSDSSRLYFIDIYAKDKNGLAVENACDIIKIQTEGNARLIGADNGDSTDYDNYRSADKKSIIRRLFSGKLLAIIRADKEADFSVILESRELKGKKLIFKNGKFSESQILPEKKLLAETDFEKKSGAENFIPVRKVEIFGDNMENGLLFDKNKRLLKAKVLIHPENATGQKMEWKVRMERGIESDCISVTDGKLSDSSEITLEAKNDGDFILSCYVFNGKKYPVLVGEISGSVRGFGNQSKNPYKPLSAAKCEKASSPVEVSFGNGVKSKDKGSWFYFENLDFGQEGSHILNIRLYSAREKEAFSIWEGKPEEGRKLSDFTFQARCQWETYMENTFYLPRRLFGKKNLSFMFESDLSFEGFDFVSSRKAFSRLNALDASAITGDSFIKACDAVEKIGNNVTLDFEDMNFGQEPASEIVICGRALHENSIQLVITGEEENIRRTLAFKSSKDYEEQLFKLPEIRGKTKVSFIFLPGSCFDFKSFIFR